jgi:hypothetical protein
MTRLAHLLALSLAMAVLGVTVAAQALPTVAGTGGNQVSIGIGMVNAGFEGLFIDAGTVVEDYLYLGLGWNLKYGQLGGDSMQESLIRGTFGIPILRQDEVIPLSFVLTGSYQKISTTGDYLEANELIRSGTAYTIAVDAYRDFRIMEALVLRPGLSGVYDAGVIITESIIGAASPVAAAQDRYVHYLYGIKVGVLLELDERLVLGTALNGHLDSEYAFHYGLIFNISSKKLR